MNFKDYFKSKLLNEALPLDTAKEYTKISKGRYQTLLDPVFQKFGSGKNKYRIYLPNVITKDDIEPVNHIPYQEIKKYIEPKGFKVTSYIKGLASDNRKNVQKIGRILNKSASEDPKAKELLSVFEQDPIRGAATLNDFRIVISRHPYDIAGMSTDRNWVSCMQLKVPYIKQKDDHLDGQPEEEGMFAGDIKRDIRKGTIIAYLIRKDDKNIERPLSRLVIKPFRGKGKDIYYYTATRIYGDDIRSFYETVNKFVNDNINTNLKSSKYDPTPGLYSDEGDPVGIERDAEGKLKFLQPLPKNNLELARPETRDEAGLIHSINDQPALEYQDGAKYWYKHGLQHRDNDLPAFINGRGTQKEWWQNNQLHRDNGPAVEYAYDDSRIWYKHGKKHRDNDLPAVTSTDIMGNKKKEWYQNDVMYRHHGPAKEILGTRWEKEYYNSKGQLHREDGPAHEDYKGNKFYYLNNHEYPNKEDYAKAIQEIKHGSK